VQLPGMVLFIVRLTQGFSRCLFRAENISIPPMGSVPGLDTFFSKLNTRRTVAQLANARRVKVGTFPYCGELATER
jgi:hypothetical protein